MPTPRVTIDELPEQTGTRTDTDLLVVQDAGTTKKMTFATLQALAAGPQGEQGDPGEGVIAGGTTGQALTKDSATDFDTEWSDVVANGWRRHRHPRPLAGCLRRPVATQLDNPVHRGLMKRTISGLWIAPNFGFLRHRKKEKTVTLPSGERVKVTVDDSGHVKQVEHDDSLDGIVRPDPIRMALQPFSVSMTVGARAHPNRIASGFRLKRQPMSRADELRSRAGAGRTRGRAGQSQGEEVGQA